MKKRIVSLALAAAMALSLTACGGSKEAAPAETKAAAPAETKAQEAAAPAKEGTETVKIICGYGVGGTADLIARKVALVGGKLHPEYNFIVENMTGGDGFAAASYYTNLDPSTKELLVYGYGLIYRHDLGVNFETEVVDFDRNTIYPIGTIDDRTWILYTTPGTTLEQILEKSKNGGIKMSGGNPLSDPHLAFGSMIAQEGGKLMVVPYDGGAAQKKGLTDGEVDVFLGTTQAAQEDVEAGTLIPILAFSDKAFEGFKTPDGDIKVPTIVGDDKDPALNADIDYSGSILKSGGFLATRVGADQAWIDSMTQVIKDVWADPEFYEWIEEIMLNKHESYGDECLAEIDAASARAIEAFKVLSGQQ